MHYRSLPAELAELLAVQVLDALPLCLSSDPNVHLEENTDFVGLIPCSLARLLPSLPLQLSPFFISAAFLLCTFAGVARAQCECMCVCLSLSVCVDVSVCE